MRMPLLALLLKDAQARRALAERFFGQAASGGPRVAALASSFQDWSVGRGDAQPRAPPDVAPGAAEHGAFASPLHGALARPRLSAGALEEQGPLALTGDSKLPSDVVDRLVADVMQKFVYEPADNFTDAVERLVAMDGAAPAAGEPLADARVQAAVARARRAGALLASSRLRSAAPGHGALDGAALEAETAAGDGRRPHRSWARRLLAAAAVGAATAGGPAAMVPVLDRAQPRRGPPAPPRAQTAAAAMAAGMTLGGGAPATRPAEKAASEEVERELLRLGAVEAELPPLIDLEDATLAAFHFADIEEHLDLAHQFLGEIEMPMRVRRVVGAATDIAEHHVDARTALNAAWLVSGELASRGLMGVDVLEDMLMLADTRNVLTDAAGVINDFVDTQRASAGAHEAAPESSESPVVAVRDDAETHPERAIAAAARGARVMMHMVKGSDAMARLSCLSHRIPRDLGHVLAVSGPHIAQVVAHVACLMHTHDCAQMEAMQAMQALPPDMAMQQMQAIEAMRVMEAMQSMQP